MWDVPCGTTKRLESYFKLKRLSYFLLLFSFTVGEYHLSTVLCCSLLKSLVYPKLEKKCNWVDCEQKHFSQKNKKQLVISYELLNVYFCLDFLFFSVNFLHIASTHYLEIKGVGTELNIASKFKIPYSIIK